MFVNWTEVKKALYPMKEYEDLSSRLEQSFSYSFVCATFNLSMRGVIEYIGQSIGADPKGRYAEYAERLIAIFSELEEVGVKDILTLFKNVRTRDELGTFSAEKAIDAPNIVSALKFLVYWFIPQEKYLGGLVQDGPNTADAIRALRDAGIRSNLDLLQKGITPGDRLDLAHSTGLSQETITDLVNRADFSRMPWASKATIANIIGAGYPSLHQLANAKPEKLFQDFYDYGKSIGKNLKLGNEVENSFRIAKIVPMLLKEE